jgi:hypothetical protein
MLRRFCRRNREVLCGTGSHKLLSSIDFSGRKPAVLSVNRPCCAADLQCEQPQKACVVALRRVVLESAPLEERVKWGHLVYFSNGPVLLIRAELDRLLFGFWRGRRLRSIEARLRPGGKYDMATLVLARDTPLSAETIRLFAVAAVELNRQFGNHTVLHDSAAPTHAA